VTKLEVAVVTIRETLRPNPRPAAGVFQDDRSQSFCSSSGLHSPKPFATRKFRHDGRHEKPRGNVGESCSNRLIKSPKLSREAPSRASFRGFSAAIIMDLVNSGLGSVRCRNSAFQSLQTASSLKPRFGNIQDASACLTAPVHCKPPL
jgi:hypothetical protein